jgi:minor extracellular serine protease Vpr
MMKYFSGYKSRSFVFIMVCCISYAFGQAKLSYNLQQLLLQSNHTGSSVYFKNGPASTELIGALIKVNPSVSMDAMTRLGVKVGTKAGNIWTVRIPFASLVSFTRLKGIQYIQMDEVVSLNLDVARRSSRVDSVHQGIQLPMAYSGKNVVVGVIDAGFDYTHPTFYDTLGNRLRIKKVWEQKNAGIPPAGYSYGNELADTVAILAKGTELKTFTHGTHVSGIAAGSGYGSLNNSKLRGIAYESDLVFVGIRPERSEWIGMGMSSIIDGIQYIYNYAFSVGKPAVVNLSWGSPVGPHDGSSLFSEAVNNLTGPGKIFVLSAGNNGEDKIHLQKIFTPSDTLVNTFTSFPTINGEQRNWIDIWGDSAKTFCVNLELYNGAAPGNKLPVICTINHALDTFLLGSDGDTCFFTISSYDADYNNKPHVFLDLYNKTSDKLNIGIKATSGTVNMWQGFVQDYTGYYGAFSQNGQTWAVDGDAEYTLGEMACTGEAITVAAYASKISFRNLQDATQSYSGYAVINQIVPFSSHGPTAGGNMKPDIAAPGMTLASSVNSFDTSYAPGGDNYTSSVALFNWTRNNRNYYFAEASGTSMSSPMVSGIVALLLQVNPGLTPPQIKKILTETAIKDNFTTQTPNPNRWGSGKINAYAAIQKALVTTGIPTFSREAIRSIRLFPNPNEGQFQLGFESNQSGQLHVVITNMLGQTMYMQPWEVKDGYNSLEFHLTDLQKGIYLVNIMGGGAQVVQKIAVQ